MGQALLKIDQDGASVPLALVLPPDLPFDGWVGEGRRLCVGNQALQWHIGDWWNYGVARYGEEKTRQAASEIWGVEGETARNCGWVAAKIGPVARATELPFSHYRAVAALPQADALPLLERAAESRMPVRELRALVREAKGTTENVRPIRAVPTPPPAPEPDPVPVPRNELAEAYSRYVEAMEAMAKLRELTRRESDFLTVALEYLGEAYAERRAKPDDFEIIFVEKGRLECETWYKASRITVNRWLLQAGKQELIDRRAAFVKSQRTMAKDAPKASIGPATPAPVDTRLPVARMAADFLRISRYGGWRITKHPQGGWLVGTVHRTSEDLIAMAERQGFNKAAAVAEATEEGY